VTETEYRYTYAAWVEAFQIFAKYNPDTFGTVVAEHDHLWAGHDLHNVSAEDTARLEELGWEWIDDIPAFQRYV
jgi:hypothetical protein